MVIYQLRQADNGNQLLLHHIVHEEDNNMGNSLTNVEVDENIGVNEYYLKIEDIDEDGCKNEQELHDGIISQEAVSCVLNDSGLSTDALELAASVDVHMYKSEVSTMVYICVMCNQQFTDKELLHVHLMEKHEQENYPVLFKTV
jgi:hypothetical protein